ncbi:MAG: ribosome recycling factor [Erysipelotrichaceae bacterium]|nr:ribosome recycling factor [Erysipelotrichaceae bacterium]
MEHLDLCEERMMEACERFENSLTRVRTGRANPTMLNGIEVDYYGAMTPLNQIASITVQEGTILVIKPYDRTSLKGIETAINMSQLNLPPQNDGSVIRLSVPKLTEETRRNYCKDVSRMTEEAKVAIRNIRRDTNDAIKKDKEISDEDLQKSLLEDVDDLTKKYIKQVEEIGAAKEKEIMTI